MQDGYVGRWIWSRITHISLQDIHFLQVSRPTCNQLSTIIPFQKLKVWRRLNLVILFKHPLLRSGDVSDIWYPVTCTLTQSSGSTHYLPSYSTALPTTSRSAHSPGHPEDAGRSFVRSIHLRHSTD
jgi:hypothetical protein